jgi:hypothetical protein
VSGAATNSPSESLSSNTRLTSRTALPTTTLSSLEARVHLPNIISTRRWSKKRTVRSEIQMKSPSPCDLVHTGIIDEAFRRPNPRSKPFYVVSFVYVNMTRPLPNPARQLGVLSRTRLLPIPLHPTTITGPLTFGPLRSFGSQGHTTKALLNPL